MQHHRSTGRGRGERRLLPPSFLIYNFDVGSANLKFEHRDFLQRQVVATLKNGGSVSIVGLTSRTGRSVENQHLSQRRADHTLSFLRMEV